jgi:glycosyltransferase involved in cell wall biosynthesis
MLTVGIPTFNRREIVCRRVAGLIAENAPEQVEIVVIDDASPDGTHAALADLCAGTPIRVLRNESNLGYAGNVLRLFEQCRTPYLLIASDDDVVRTDCLAPLTQLLGERSPAFVSTQFCFGDELYRGGPPQGQIEPEELLAASSHAPGLVYGVPDCREVALGDVSERLRSGSAAAHVYPQVLILARLLIAEKRCLWWDRCAVEGGPRAPTGIKDGEGSPYYHLAPRWMQVKDLLDFLGEAGSSAANPEVAAKMTAKVEEGLFWRLRSAIEYERPELLAPFDRSAARFYAGRWLWGSLLRRLRRRG